MEAVPAVPCARKSEGKEGGLKEKVQHGPSAPCIAQVRLISGVIQWACTAGI